VHEVEGKRRELFVAVRMPRIVRCEHVRDEVLGVAAGRLSRRCRASDASGQAQEGWHVTRLVQILVFAIVTAFVTAASAHEVGVSNGSYRAVGATLEVEISLARRELSSAPNAVVDRVRVRGDGVECAGTLVSTRFTENDGIAIAANYTCRAPPGKVVVDLPLLDDLSHGHRHFAHVVGATEFDVLLFRGHTSFETSAAHSEAPTANAWSLLRMGVEHILTGYDHLVFLFALILVGGRTRAIVSVITAFTLGHSITLALATLGVWAPSPSIIEPSIALSIAYVGVENFFVKDASKRFLITFPFGLVHGFGFAGALQEIHLPAARVPAALLYFNLGVEAGQLAVLAVVLPVVVMARRNPGFRGVGVRALSAAVIVAGLVWFVARVRGV